jgi:hypothetical protein
MKCPHCHTAIHDGFTVVPIARYVGKRSANGDLIPETVWSASHQQCPECWKAIIYVQSNPVNWGTPQFLAYPANATLPVPAEVGDPYRKDFLEASAVLSISPKASAALSRRNVQAILRDFANTKSKDLYDQIEEIISSGQYPSYITEGLHAVRVIGNIAAHSTKSTNTGDIVDVAEGEAEWNLDTLDSLFDFFFVQPAIAKKRRNEMNAKLIAAGKNQLN